MSDDTDPTTEMATELYFAKRRAEIGEFQKMYEHIFNAMALVPDDANVAWEIEQTLHEPMGDGTKINNGYGTASDPIDAIQSMIYQNNDLGTDYISVKPAGYDND